MAEITSRTPATTLLASVEPCSEPDAAPPRDLFGHHAACQRGAMFRTRLPRRATSSATTLLASVEPCSEPDAAPPRDLLGHHAACQRGAMFRTRRSPRRATSSATTLLASVEPCSEPDAAPPRDLLGHHAACQRGAMFKTRRCPAARPLRPPRCLPAWSHVRTDVVAKQRTFGGHSQPSRRLVLNTVPRWRAAW